MFTFASWIPFGTCSFFILPGRQLKQHPQEKMKKLASGHGEYTMIEEKDQAVNMFRRFRGPIFFDSFSTNHAMQQGKFPFFFSDVVDGLFSTFVMRMLMLPMHCFLPFLLNRTCEIRFLSQVQNCTENSVGILWCGQEERENGWRLRFFGRFLTRGSHLPGCLFFWFLSGPK